MEKLIYIISILSLSSCSKSTNNIQEEIEKELKRKIEHFSQYMGDSLLSNKQGLIRHYIEIYLDDSSSFNYEGLLDKDFEGIHIIQGIKENKQDTVFVMSAIQPSENEEGIYDEDSYYFYDPTIPRLRSDSQCAHPYNLWTLDDIDEDGINEVVMFHSGCASRYKALIVYSLKGDTWIPIGVSTFDVLTLSQEGLDFSTFVRKIKKNIFEMYNIEDGVKQWERTEIQ